jgi:hypothetical protein
VVPDPAEAVDVLGGQGGEVREEEEGGRGATQLTLIGSPRDIP